MGDEQLHRGPNVIRFSPQPDPAGDQALKGKGPGPQEPSPPVIDITDEALEEVAVGEDFPVVVYLREQLARLRAEIDGAHEEADIARQRALLREREADQSLAGEARLRQANRALEKSLREERRRADRLEARLARTLEKVESRRSGWKLAQRAGKKRSLGSIRRAFGKGRSTNDEVDPQEMARIESLGKMAHLHKEMTDRKGAALTLGESLELRRIHYGDNVRASASLFGRADSRAILYRDVPEGARRSLSDSVRLTEEGERLAAAYRRLKM